MFVWRLFILLVSQVKSIGCFWCLFLSHMCDVVKGVSCLPRVISWIFGSFQRFFVRWNYWNSPWKSWKSLWILSSIKDGNLEFQIFGCRTGKLHVNMAILPCTKRTTNFSKITSNSCTRAYWPIIRCKILTYFPSTPIGSKPKRETKVKSFLGKRKRTNQRSQFHHFLDISCQIVYNIGN